MAEPGGKMEFESLAREERDRFLAGTWLATLATIRRDGSPQISPVWYHYDGARLLIIAGATTAKVRNIQRDNRVAISVAMDRPPYVRVLIYGRAHIGREGTQELRQHLCVHYLGQEEGEAYAEELKETDSVTIVVEPDKIITRNG